MCADTAEQRGGSGRKAVAVHLSASMSLSPQTIQGRHETTIKDHQGPSRTIKVANEACLDLKVANEEFLDLRRR